VIGPARTGVCTLLHDLVLGLCAAARPPARPQIPIPLLICGNATRASICMLGLTGPWHELSAAEAIDRWWSAVELDLRRHVDRSWRAAPLRGDACEPLVILGGVDELRELAAQQTVLAWARELALAEVRVIVSSRDDELAEQRVLCGVEDPSDDISDDIRAASSSPSLSAALLRRLHVLPLTRPPIDRFLARWARIDGAWGRAAPERLKAAIAAKPGLARLARRPADLAVLAVLSASDAELPDNLADLHRAMLGSLDLGHPAHRQLLARVVADPDSALDMPTRRAWLAALVAMAVAYDHVDLGEALGRDVRLGRAGAALLLAATRAWAEGGCPLRPVLADSPVRIPRAALRRRPRRRDGAPGLARAPRRLVGTRGDLRPAPGRAGARAPGRAAPVGDPPAPAAARARGPRRRLGPLRRPAAARPPARPPARRGRHPRPGHRFRALRRQLARRAAPGPRAVPPLPRPRARARQPRRRRHHPAGDRDGDGRRPRPRPRRRPRPRARTGGRRPPTSAQPRRPRRVQRARRLPRPRAQPRRAPHPLRRPGPGRRPRARPPDRDPL
jgi:hypothetical protein